MAPAMARREGIRCLCVFYYIVTLQIPTKYDTSRVHHLFRWVSGESATSPDVEKPTQTARVTVRLCNPPQCYSRCRAHLLWACGGRRRLTFDFIFYDFLWPAVGWCCPSVKSSDDCCLDLEIRLCRGCRCLCARAA